MTEPLRLLIVEDSESDAELILRQLKNTKYTIHSIRVESADGFSRELLNHPWDIIIADYQLPGFNAPAALALLQDTGLDIPFIVVSGAIGEETAVELMRCGACDYLMKGSLVRLASVIERELSEAQIRQERRLALEALLESENNLRKSQKIAHVGHWVWHKKSGNFECSDEMMRIFNIQYRDFSIDLFGPESKVIHPEDVARVAEIFMRYKNCQAQKSFDYRVVHKDGSVRDILSLAGDCVLDKNGELISLSGVVQDITERKRSERELQQWADAFKNCSHGIAMINPETNRIMICNPAFARIVRSQVEQIIDRPLLNMYLPEEHYYVNNCFSEADCNGQVRFESYMFRDDDSVIPVQMDLVSVQDHDDGLLYRVATMQDITGRKQSENILYQEIDKNKMRARELEAITDVSFSMRRAQTKSELVSIVAGKMKDLLQAQYALLAFVDGDVYIYPKEDILSCNRLNLMNAGNGGLFEEVFRDGKPMLAETLENGLRSKLPAWVFESGFSISSMLVYPLQIEMTTIGLILLAFEQSTCFKPEQVNLVAAVAEMAGSALNRMQAVEDLENMVGRREEELDSIYQVTSAASKTLDIKHALQQALELTLQAVHTNVGGIYLLDESGRKPQLLVDSGFNLELSRKVKPEMNELYLERTVQNKKAIVIPCLDSEPNHQNDGHFSWVGLPMRIQDRVIGILVILKECGQQVNVDEMTLLSFIADHLALVVENTRLYQKAERSAVLNERSRMARELHDSVTQSLYSANLYSVGAQRYIGQGNYQEVENYLEEIGRLTHQSLCDMRLMVYELRPPELIRSGIVGALQNRLDAVERRSKIKVNLNADDDLSLPEKIEENLYWIAIEALNNSLKHAHASRISINIFQEGSALVMSVSDNGNGFDIEPAQKNGGVGLKSMRERIEASGGRLKIQSTPGIGTTIEASIPDIQKKLLKTEVDVD